VKNLDANIDRIAATAVAALGAITIAAAFVAAFGFARRIDGTLGNGRNGLGLYLGNGLSYGFLRHHTGCNRCWRKRGYLHNLLTTKLLEHFSCLASGIVPAFAGTRQKKPIKTSPTPNKLPNKLSIPECSQTPNGYIIPQYNQKIINHLVMESILARIEAILGRLLIFNFSGFVKSRDNAELLSGLLLCAAARPS
jgi:hypothetical protein